MPRKWKEMDADVMNAPSGWRWTVDDDLAHHVWMLTERTPEVGWGPDPPLLLESMTGNFTDRSASDNLNSWYHTRIPGESYNADEWRRIPTKFRSPDPNDRMDKTDILYDENISPHPLRSKLHAQQYTSTGAMFTYDFTQWQGEDPSGFMRIPVPDELNEEAVERVEELPFEKSQYQSRVYRSQYADVPVPDGTFAHPHFSPVGSPSKPEYMELFDVAFEMMRRGTRMEKNRL